MSKAMLSVGPQLHIQLQAGRSVENVECRSVECDSRNHKTGSFTCMRHFVNIPAIKMTNQEGINVSQWKWKTADLTDLPAYVGLLILAGVHRSGEDC